MTCPSGTNAVAFTVQNGPRKGFLSIMVAPADAKFILQPPWADRPSGTVGAVVKAPSGKSVIVVVEPVLGSAAPPLDAGEVRRMAEALAPGF
ncbi:hypothetical protein [Actinokineospora sp.]|uniref:hypothetical protein n=1 Tax=Actinokineospora sp. TaxID=1872133 RepID=UPI004037B840